MPTALHDLRRTRRVHRLGELEWFEIAYRVYLTALGGGVVVLWLTDLVTDEPATSAQVAEVLARGPAVLGMAAAIAVAAGLRSGSDGGPVSVEPGDVRHLLLAPIPRRQVLIRPVTQRLRALGYAAGVVGAIGGLLAAPRLPGSPAAWMASGAVAALAVAALFVAIAVLTHALRIPRPVATLAAGVVLAWQATAAADLAPGPLDAIGGLALWAMRVRAAEALAGAAVVALVATAIACAGRLRVEALVRRADLVSQLHFAVAVQDLRTVVLLRRQLRGEHARPQPWWPVRPAKASVPAGRNVWRRGARGLARSPLSRLGRITGLAVAAGLCSLAVLAGTTPAVVGLGAALFLLGLDVFEPLAQEIDRPDRTDGLPHPRGWLLAHHLAAPAIALVPVAAIGAAVVAIGHPPAAAGAFALALPITVVGCGGAVISTVRGAPDPTGAFNTASAPEFSGMREAIRLLLPLAISTLAAVPVLVLRERPTVDTAARAGIALVLLAAAMVLWVRRSDEYRARLQAFLAGGGTNS